MKNKTRLDLYRKSHMLKSCVTIFILLLFFSCSKEDGGKRNGGDGDSDIKTSVFPEGSGIVNCIPNELEGTVDLYADTNEKYYFEKWTGDINSTENPLTIASNSSINIIANFKLVPKVTVQQVGEGRIIQNTFKDKETSRYITNLRAIPETTWEFSGWSGDIISDKDSLSIVLEGEDKNITATFTELAWEFDPPEIVSFTFSPEEIDVTNASQVVTVTVHVTDKSRVNGFLNACISNRTSIKQYGEFKLTSGTLKDGIYIAEVVIHKGVPSGEWSISAGPFEDVFGNYSESVEPTGTKNTLTVINRNIDTPEK